MPQFLRVHRQVAGWRQADLSARSGVPIATLKRFERTGQISLPALAKIIATLGLTDRLLGALEPKQPDNPISMEEFLKPVNGRQRVRVKR